MAAPARHAYLVRDSTAWVAFVPVFGAFIRTHWCVLVVACSMCEAQAGSPCLGRGGPTSVTHYVRREAAQRIRKTTRITTKLRKARPGIVLALDMLRGEKPCR